MILRQREALCGRWATECLKKHFAGAWAAESGLTEVTSNGSENGEKLQAKSIDGRDTLTEVSDLVLEMIHNEEIRYNEEIKQLKQNKE